MSNILVTGATGFVGMRVIPRLIEAGHNIYALSRQNIPSTHTVTYVQCDLTNPADVEAAYATIGDVDILLDLAADIPGKRNAQETEADFQTYMDTNVSSRTVLLQHFGKQLKHIVFTSTADVYGRKEGLFEINEQTPVNPSTYYAVSKVAAEQFLQVWAAAHGVELTIARLAQVYGGGDVPVKFIPMCIEKARKGEAFTLYGSGEQKRSYIYVEDVAALLSAVGERNGLGILNLAGPAVSLNHVLAMLEQSGVGLRIEKKETVAEPMSQVIETKKMHASFPDVALTSLQDGLHATVESYG